MKRKDPKLYLVGDNCANFRCAIGCADRDVESRLDTYYKAESEENKIDFNFCHPLWQKHYIIIDPPNQDNKRDYVAIGSIAALINITVILVGVYYIYKLAQEKRITDEVRHTLEVNSGQRSARNICFQTIESSFSVSVPKQETRNNTFHQLFRQQGNRKQTFRHMFRKQRNKKHFFQLVFPKQ